MPDIRQVLRAYARKHGIRLDIVEKDYALSYLLDAIANTPDLGDKLALKGGTALKKLYFPDYRFSEDLDYSTIRLGPIKNATDKMRMVVDGMRASLFERGPFEVQYEPLVLKLPHPDDQLAYLVRVQFPSQRQSLCRLKVEITVDEPILLPVEQRTLIHNFDESIKVRICCYALAEIVAEKLRALLQSRARLSKRGWGASRVCRDYFDLWTVLQRGDYFDGNIPGLVKEKCKVRGVHFADPSEFLAPELLSVAQEEWLQQLSPFVPNAPPAEQILSRVQPLILALWE